MRSQNTPFPSCCTTGSLAALGYSGTITWRIAKAGSDADSGQGADRRLHPRRRLDQSRTLNYVSLHFSTAPDLGEDPLRELNWPTGKQLMAADAARRPQSNAPCV